MTLADRTASYIIKRFRGTNVTIAPNLSSSEVLVNLLQKGLIPYLRGSLVRPFLGRSKGNFFLGKGCKIINKNLLRVGRTVYIGNYSYLDCLSVGGVNLGDNVTLREGCWLQMTSGYDNPGAAEPLGGRQTRSRGRFGGQPKAVRNILILDKHLRISYD